MSRTNAKHQVVDFDQLPADVSPCRDERCPVIGLHAEHKVYRGPGRISKTCPNCFKHSVQVTPDELRCPPCGWSRLRGPSSPEALKLREMKKQLKQLKRRRKSPTA